MEKESSREENCDRFRTKDILNGPYEKLEGSFPFWDPNLFVDDDQRVYFYWGCSNVMPIWGVELDPETGAWRKLFRADGLNHWDCINHEIFALMDTGLLLRYDLSVHRRVDGSLEIINRIRCQVEYLMLIRLFF